MNGFYTIFTFKRKANYSCLILGISLLCSPDRKPITSGVAEWGVWGLYAECPPNERVIGFKIKVESNQGIIDDTATNAIRLKCESGFELQSTEGKWGILFKIFLNERFL